ncbi:hypothetical protein THUN1379_12110 [Paludibacterium sp. THUN1379]|uniref:hypothetical protein n=1 Tax=Paludibacterium sp. THUN1379 TaxID=3112107 RepID=UPI0030921E1D|nr:hypothetical protein THUN1379_12110 [Paludibacterium sp. THUN1379]
MKMTLKVLMTTLGLTLSLNALAEDRPPAFNLSDLGQLFRSDDSRPMQLATLSPQEMQDTQGAFNPAVAGAVIGAAGGGARYIAHTISNNQPWSGRMLAGSVASGAAVGAYIGTGAALAGGGRTVGAMIWRAKGEAMNIPIGKIWQRN